MHIILDLYLIEIIKDSLIRLDYQEIALLKYSLSRILLEISLYLDQDLILQKKFLVKKLLNIQCVLKLVNLLYLLFHIGLHEKELVPGPGTYESLKTITTDGKYFFSRFKNSGSTAMKSTEKRFMQTLRSSNVPGPGQYEHVRTITNNGNYNVSKYQSSGCRKFGTEKRGSSHANLCKINIEFHMSNSNAWTWNLSLSI